MPSPGARGGSVYGVFWVLELQGRVVALRTREKCKAVAENWMSLPREGTVADIGVPVLRDTKKILVDESN
jgi:hypothetical protein